MDWLARSIANSLNLHDAGDGDDEDDNTSNATDPKSPPPNQILEDNQHRPINSPPPSSSPRGVKEDISDLTKSLTRQFWGVASFLAPPPPEQSKARDPSDPEVAEEDLIAGIRSDFAEISGKFKTGISKLSSNIAVSDITKIASNFLQIGSEQDAVDQDLVGNAVGVTEEVLALARNLAMHPETWLHFPVPDYEYFDDFDMSNAQQEHALAVERLVQRLAALKIELCPGYMSEGCFWKIYFVLLHPRLNKQDAELLSTPQIVEARAMLMQELQNRNKANPEADLYGMGSSYSKGSARSPREEHLSVPSSAKSESAPLKTSIIEAAPTTAVDFETEKHPIQSSEVQIVYKSVVEEEPMKRSTIEHSQSSSSKISDEKYEDDGDDWLKEESSEIVGLGGTTVPLGNDDDVSFSDLEDDDDRDAPTSYKKVTYGSDSSTKDSRDWVQLSRSSTDSLKDSSSASIKQMESEQVSARNPETKESNDWLNVDDIDVL